MAKYLGPKIKILRRLGKLFGLTLKEPSLRLNTPGEHGLPISQSFKRPSVYTDYKDRLLERRRIQLNYGVTRRCLVSYYNQCKNKKGLPSIRLTQLLESRLDAIVFRLGFAPTIPSARQMVSHGHILVNNKLINIPSFFCKKNDTISVRSDSSLKSVCLENIRKIEKKRTEISERLANLKSLVIDPKQVTLKHVFLDKELLIGKILSKFSPKDARLLPKEVRF